MRANSFEPGDLTQEQQAAPGIQFFRGLLVGIAINAPFWAVIATIV